MLSLMSTSTPTLTGTRSRVNCVMTCGSPSSNTSKSSRVRPVTSLPSASRTVTVTPVTSMPDLKALRIPDLRRRAGSASATTGTASEQERAVDVHGLRRRHPILAPPAFSKSPAG